MKRGAGASLKLLQGRAMLLLYHFFTDRPVLLRAHYVCSGHENVLCAASPIKSGLNIAIRQGSVSGAAAIA